MAVGSPRRSPFGLTLFVGFGIVGDLLRIADEAQRAVGHVAKDVLRFVEDLGRFGTVDGVEIGVVLKTVLPGRRRGPRARS